MKKTVAKIMLPGSFLFSCFLLHAQDSTIKSAKQQINQRSEQADNLYGKKIQQQTLFNQSFEKLDTAALKPVKKKAAKKPV